MTAIASITTATSMMRVARSIGVRLSPRSVRYQWPSSRPSSTEPRNAAPASSSNRASAYCWRPVAAIATSTAIETGTETKPTIREPPGSA